MKLTPEEIAELRQSKKAIAEYVKNTLHTCSYECDRPECIKAQRDELRAKMEANTAEIRRLYQLCMDQQGEIYALKMARSMEQKTAALREAPNTKTAE